MGDPNITLTDETTKRLLACWRWCFDCEPQGIEQGVAEVNGPVKEGEAIRGEDGIWIIGYPPDNMELAILAYYSCVFPD